LNEAEKIREKVASIQGSKPQRPSRSLLRAFNWYIAWYLWLHFHGLHTANTERFPVLRADNPPVPTILFLNHASWWDPLICIRLARRWLPDYDHYAPMDAAALGHYGFFRKLGLFPIEMGTTHGAVSFLQTGQAILRSNQSILWITPQGRFTDVRKRPVQLMAGLGALVHRLPECRLVPLAIEYAFWDERLPEILCNVGKVVDVQDGRRFSAEYWTLQLANSMENTLDELSTLVQTRDPRNFQTITKRRVGVGGVYQLWQRLGARLRGKPFRPEHRSIGDA